MAEVWMFVLIGVLLVKNLIFCICVLKSFIIDIWKGFIMRKFISFVMVLVSFLFISPSRAELHVDVVAGGVDPIAIAIQKFETIGKVSNSDAKMLREVVENDLKRTGLFRIVNHDAFPEFVKMNEMPNFKSWAAIKTQVLAQASIQPEGKDSYKLEFYLWDVNGQEQIEAQSLIASKKSIRRLAHIMADAIYERLTGEVGYFDTQIVFIAETGSVSNRVKRMAIMDQDGYGMRFLSDKKTFVMSPHFSPNMSTVVFLSYRNDDPMVWVLDLDTGDQTKLGNFGGMSFAPRFSPDGSKVALSLVKNGVTNIYEYDMATKGLRQLTFGNHIDTSPSYSPDGRYMVYNSDSSGSQQIHVMDLKTGKQKRITFGAGRYATPAWSPDGQFIAFTKMADNTFYIGIMNPEGRHEKILAGGWYMEAPSWAPGSRRLVYYETERTADGEERVSHIRSVDITGQNIYDIDLKDGLNGTEPTWSPKLP